MSSPTPKRHLGDALTINHRRKISELSAKNGIPSAYGYREFVEAGGLMSYGPSLPEMYRRAAEYVDKILRGAKPADLPVEQPTKFELEAVVATRLPGEPQSLQRVSERHPAAGLERRRNICC